MFCWLAKTYTPLASYPQIGRALGGRDHTTVMHGVRCINAMISEGDREIVAMRDACVERVEALIKERAQQ